MCRRQARFDRFDRQSCVVEFPAGLTQNPSMRRDYPTADAPVAPAIQRPAPAPSIRAAHYDDYHRLVLAIAAGVLIAAGLLQVRTDQRIAVSLLSAWPLPEVCQSKVLLGLDCPGCGLTRSFVHLAHGDLTASLAVHPLGWLVACFVALQIPYRTWALCSANGAPLGNRLPWSVTAALVIALVAAWIARLLT